MDLLYSRQYLLFSEALQQNPELLRHRDCRFCDSLHNDNSEEQLLMSPFSLVLLARDNELASRAIELVDSRGLWDSARCALFLIVDFCCSKQACSTDEPQLARFFLRLSRRHQDSCVRLLSEELTEECLTPLEYAACRECFHLAAAFANAPGYLMTERQHPGNPSLLVEEVDLTRYSDDGGDRFLKSPFLHFIRSSQDVIGTVIPPGFICFFNSPVTQAFLVSVAHLKQNRKVSFCSLLVYLLIYLALLFTMTTRIFTRGTFDPGVQVHLPGPGNSNISYFSMVPSSFVTSIRYVFYVRLALQASAMVMWLFWIAARLADVRCRLRLVRKRHSMLNWLDDAISMRGCQVMELAGVLFNCLHLVMLFMELYIFNYPRSYFEQNGLIYVEMVPLQIAIVMNYFYTFMLELFFIASMAMHHRVFLNVLLCMNAAMKLVFLITLPLALVCSTMLLSQPFIDCSEYSFSCVIEYLGRSFRYVFSLSSFPGISDSVSVWPQIVIYLFVAIFILNFGVAVLTQQISMLEENSEFRKIILGAAWSHQYVTLRYLLNCRLKTVRQQPLVLQRALSRLKVECGEGCCVQNCLQHTFEKIYSGEIASV